LMSAQFQINAMEYANSDGGFSCTNCPHGKVYDPTKHKCVMLAKLHNIILGRLLSSIIGI